MDALGAGQPVRAEMHSVIVVDTETPHVRHQKSIGHHFMCGYNPGTSLKRILDYVRIMLTHAGSNLPRMHIPWAWHIDIHDIAFIAARSRLRKLGSAEFSHGPFTTLFRKGRSEKTLGSEKTLSQMTSHERRKTVARAPKNRRICTQIRCICVANETQLLRGRGVFHSCAAGTLDFQHGHPPRSSRLRRSRL